MSACGGQRKVSAVIPQAPSTPFFGHKVSLWPGTHQVIWSKCTLSPRDPPVSISPLLELQARATMPGFYMWILWIKLLPWQAFNQLSYFLGASSCLLLN